MRLLVMSMSIAWVGLTSGAPGGAVPAALAVPGSAHADTAARADTVAVITMGDSLNFVPATRTVVVGETVEWRNTSATIHTVTADPERASRETSVLLPEGAEPFGSGILRPGESFRHTFTVPGVYRYFCIPHEGAGMVAELTVVAPKTP